MHKLRDASGDPEEDLREQLRKIAREGRIYVLGLGNTDRADDGAGILVAEALKKPFPNFSFSEHDGVEGTVLDISQRDEKATVFFVDAADLRLKPGAIRVVPREEIKETEITTHRVAVALLMSMLRSRGKDSAVIAIQPGSIEFRGPLTKGVKKSIRVLVKSIEDVMHARNSQDSKVS